MDQLIEWSGAGKAGRATHRMLTTAELVSLAGSASAVIGAHTHNHPKLSVCTGEDQRKEISQSKSILENLLNREIIHFSYPFGSQLDYTPETVEICKKLGLKIVSANYHNQLHSWHSNFELPRMLVRNWNLKEFESKMHTFYNY
jgi:peptidoglycan/xylan/chitin deacetylase (PgdA/CDA1 family)